MSIKLKELLDTKPKPKVIAEGLFSKLKSLFGMGEDDLSKLKKDKKFMGHLKKMNNHYSNMEKHIKKRYGQKVSLRKMKASDFL
tara:strand:- start:58 stop:309 length:252 start_codon:yes stop_codon:yes gene_type:complete